MSRCSSAAPATDPTRLRETAVPVETDVATDRLAKNGAEVAEKVESQTEGSPDTGDILGSDDTPSGDQGDDGDVEDADPAKTKREFNWPGVLAYGLLPGLVLLLAGAAGFLKWQESSASSSQIARIESVAAAKDATAAMLSYQPDTVDKDLGAARDRLTGPFKESYTQLTGDVVIPGARQRHISAVAKVPAAASVSATPNHAVALVFVDQTVVVGTDAPTDTASTVRVTLDKVGGRWLISSFDPV